MIDSQFSIDIIEGLSASPKFLQSKYLYDDKGSDLFRQIMELPEYYLTRAELEIFTNKSRQIIDSINADQFNIIELGAGDGYKTREFLKALNEARIQTNYFPVDISQEALDKLMENLEGVYPKENIELHNGDYFIELDKVYSSDIMEVVLFLGSNIGNYKYGSAVELLQLIGGKIKQGDVLLLGVDLQKEPNLIARAYNDNQGVTRQFNLNLLERINRELDGGFDMANFEFYSHYNPESGEVKSYLISLQDQNVNIAAAGKTFAFKKNELISTELSKKYSIDDIKNLADEAGYKMQGYILDDSQYFAECILKRL